MNLARKGAQKKFGEFEVPPNACKSTKGAPKKFSRAPKMSPSEPPNPIKSIFRSQTLIFENPIPAIIKLRFLTVGGTAWEFKIDTKRRQDEENNDFEEGGERRDEKEQ